jgi:hypothetical protein
MRNDADAVTAGTSETAAARGRAGGIKWWPAVLAIGFATFVAWDLFTGEEHGQEMAAIVAASGLVYLAAAALEKPWVAWPIFIISVLVITLARIGLIGIDATWPLLVMAGLFIGYGLVRGAMRPERALPSQALAMVGFGAIAVVALFVQPVVGAYLVAAGLLAHAAWDFHHHRADKTVVRSMAEFCFVLDVALGVAIIVATVQA